MESEINQKAELAKEMMKDSKRAIGQIEQTFLDMINSGMATSFLHSVEETGNKKGRIEGILIGMSLVTFGVVIASLLK